MVIIGPINNNTSFVFIAFEKELLTIVKLDFKASFIHALNDQLPFFYSNYFENTMKLPLAELKNKFKTDTFKKSELLSIDLRKSKTWSHKIIIKTQYKELKFGLTDRNKVQKYEEIINKWKS